MEPSKEAIVAALEVYYDKTGDRIPAGMDSALRAAYAIDFAALRAELQAARDEIRNSQASRTMLAEKYDALALKFKIASREPSFMNMVNAMTTTEERDDLQQQLQAARDEIERLKKDPLCQAITDPDCTCHSCLKDGAIEMALKAETELQIARDNYQTLLDDAVKMRQDIEKQPLVQILNKRLSDWATRFAEQSNQLQVERDENEKLKSDISVKLLENLLERRKAINDLESKLAAANERIASEKQRKD